MASSTATATRPKTITLKSSIMNGGLTIPLAQLGKFMQAPTAATPAAKAPGRPRSASQRNRRASSANAGHTNS
jgi:hypothetical protein